MKNQQLEMSLLLRSRDCRRHQWERRRQHAHWWFKRMRALVDQAPDWSSTAQWRQAELIR